MTLIYWVVENTMLKSLLERAHKGEDPELLCLELYANSEVADE